MLRHTKKKKSVFLVYNMAAPRTPEGGVSCAWPASSSSGLDASTCITAEKLAEETIMDHNVGPLYACISS